MEAVNEIKDALEATLNSQSLSGDSIYGIVIIAVICLLVYKGIKSVTNSLGSIIGFILLLEVGHVCAFSTTLGAQAPILQAIFKYDVLTALAQLCVGTPVSQFLLYVQAWMNAVMQRVVDVVGTVGQYAMRYIESTGVLNGQ